MTTAVLRATALELDAASPGELPGLEAFLAEHGAPLRWFEGHRCFLPTGRTGGDGLYPFARGSGAGGPGGALALTRLAPLRLVLEVLVGEELLLAGRPDELRTAVHTPEDPVLELHRSLPRRGRSSYSSSRRSFFRLRFRASACLARRLSPGFK